MAWVRILQVPFKSSIQSLSITIYLCVACISCEACHRQLSVPSNFSQHIVLNKACMYLYSTFGWDCHWGLQAVGIHGRPGWFALSWDWSLSGTSTSTIDQCRKVYIFLKKKQIYLKYSPISLKKLPKMSWMRSTVLIQTTFAQQEWIILECGTCHKVLRLQHTCTYR